MGKEYEAKFLDINVEKMRKKLKELGGILDHKKTKYVRSVFNLCDFNNNKGYARVRDEGGKVTITVKVFNDKDYPDEYEVTVKEGFEEARNLLKALNLDMKAFQESYREKWSMPTIEGVHEITFDTIPGIPTYMEVDCTTEESLHKAIKKLELDKSKMRKGAFDRTYEEYYGIPRDVLNNKTPSLSFKNIINEIKPTKNKDLLIKMHKEQSQLGGYKYKYKKYKNKYMKLKK